MENGKENVIKSIKKLLYNQRHTIELNWGNSKHIVIGRIVCDNIKVHQLLKKEKDGAFYTLKHDKIPW